MVRPEVTPGNYPAVYDYYKQLTPSAHVLQGLHWAMSKMYRPAVHFADGARERVDELLDSEHRLIIACNHVNMFDQLPAAAALHQRPLRRIVGNTIVLAKQPYFKNPAVRRLLDLSGAIPVFRDKDLSEEAGITRREQVAIGQTLVSTVAQKIDAGYHMFLFPEGTRNQGDPSELGKIKSGIGRMTVAAANTPTATGAYVPVALLPMAIWYGSESRHSFAPTIHFGSPQEGPFTSATQVTRNLAEGMAESLLAAIELSASAPEAPAQAA